MSIEKTHSLIVKGLHKKFGGKEVVRGVDLEANGGEVVGLLGPNGAGKTTTFSMVAGFLRPTSGTLSLNGIDTAIHYPFPIHLQPASKKLGFQVGDFPITERQAKEILTLPVNQYVNEGDIRRIIKLINEFKHPF